MIVSVISGALQGELASASRLVGGALALQAPFFLAVIGVFVLGWEVDAVDVTAIQVGASVLGIYFCWRLLKAPTGVGPTLDGAEVSTVTRRNYLNAVGSVDSIGLDRNLVGALLGTAALGLYSTATIVASMTTIVGNAVSTVLMPRLAAAHDDPAEQRRLMRQWLPAAAVLIVGFVAALQVVVGPVIEYAFGAEFTPAIEVARWLLVADGLLGFRRVLISVLQASGRGSVASWIELVMTLLLAGGIVLAAHNDSLLQVGIATFVVGLLSCVSLLVAIAATRTGDERGRHRHTA
jgi:O-antigen/teichoic acid export membrane protein